MKWLLLLLALGARATASDLYEEPQPVLKAHGVTVTRRIEMVTRDGGQFPGFQRLYASTPGHREPFVIFRSERKARAEVSPGGRYALVIDNPQFQLFRLILVDLKEAAAMDEPLALSSLRGVALLGHFDLGWIRELDYLAFQRIMATKPDPAVMLKPVFLGFSSDEKRLLMTYDIVDVLAVDKAAIQAKKTYKRRYYAIDPKGGIIREYKGSTPPAAW